jgi:hypothetical protein
MNGLMIKLYFSHDVYILSNVHMKKKRIEWDHNQGKVIARMIKCRKGYVVQSMGYIPGIEIYDEMRR